MRKVAIILLLLQTILLGIAQAGFGGEKENSGNCSKSTKRIIEKKAGDYRVRISHSDDRMCQHLEILKQNQVVYKEEGFDNHYTLGNDWNDRHNPYLMNLTGHSIQLIVSKWTGGAHCCNSLLIFDVRGEFRKIDEIYGGNYNFEIVDLDHDGIPEIRLTDDFLAYLFSSFAYSARATVILKYVNGHYSVAPELMRRPVRLKWFDAKVPKWRKLLREHRDPDWPPPPFIQAMTDLIFTGNEKLANSGICYLDWLIFCFARHSFSEGGEFYFFFFLLNISSIRSVTTKPPTTLRVPKMTARKPRVSAR